MPRTRLYNWKKTRASVSYAPLFLFDFYWPFEKSFILFSQISHQEFSILQDIKLVVIKNCTINISIWNTILVWPHLWSTVVLIPENAHFCLKSWYQQIMFPFDLFLDARDMTKIGPFFRKKSFSKVNYWNMVIMKIVQLIHYSK